MCLPLGERAFFIVSHEATVASNIGRKNGCEPSRYAFAGQDMSPVSVEGRFKLSVVHCSMGSRDPNALCGRSRFGSPAHKIPHRRGGRGILNAINVLGLVAWKRAGRALMKRLSIWPISCARATTDTQWLIGRSATSFKQFNHLTTH